MFGSEYYFDVPTFFHFTLLCFIFNNLISALFVDHQLELCYSFFGFNSTIIHLICPVVLFTEAVTFSYLKVIIIVFLQAKFDVYNFKQNLGKFSLCLQPEWEWLHNNCDQYTIRTNVR